MTERTTVDPATIELDGEEWITFGPPGERRRIGFHDYATLYGEPGLYDAVFYERLRMRTTDLLVGLYVESVCGLGRDPRTERVVDLGAGSGRGGALLRQRGVAAVRGVDVEPAAAVAAERDHPGAYDEYLVVDADDAAAQVLAAFGAERASALLALASVGADHVDVDELATLFVGLVERRGLLAFAVEDTGAESFRRELGARVPLDDLTVVRYVHRVRPDGTAHRAVAYVAQRSDDS